MTRGMAGILSDIVNPATWAGALFYGALFLFGAYLLVRMIRRATRALLDRDAEVRIDRTAAHFSLRIAQGAVFLIAVLLYAHLIPALRSLGTALLASAGLLTVVIGLAAQGTLGNLVAGIAIMLYRPFKVGDVVQLQTPGGSETGTLERISLGYTVLRTYDGRRVVVPNTVMAGQVTVNLSSPDLLAVVELRLAYGSDVDQARALAVDAAHAHPAVAAVQSCPLTRVAEEGIVLSLRVVCDAASGVYQTQLDLTEAILQRYRDAGIDLFHASSTVELRDARSP